MPITHFPISHSRKRKKKAKNKAKDSHSPSPFVAHELGQSERKYDTVSEEDGDEEKAIIANVLQWMEEEVPEHKTSVKSQKSRHLQELIEAGMTLERVNKIGAISALQMSPHKGTLIERATDVLRDLYYAARDLLSGKRVKTSLFITLCIGLGAAAGFVIGTFLLPGLGSAIGGAAGAALASGLAAIGGAIGTTIIGAFLGSWLGKKLSAKIFKHEKRFELSKKVTTKIKRQTGVNSEVATMINGYLYHRKNKSKSELCSYYYKILRKKGIYNADPVAMEKIAHFFCHELRLLELEREAVNADPKLEKDLEAVRYILNHLGKASGLAPKTRDTIAKNIAAFELRQLNHRALPKRQLTELRHFLGEDDAKPDMPAPEQEISRSSEARKPIQKQSIEYHSVVPVSRKVMGEMKDRFVEKLKDNPYDIKKVQVIDDNDFSSAIRYRYHFETQNKTQLPDMIFHERAEGANHFVTEVMVEGDAVTKKNQAAVVGLMIEQAKAFHEKTGNVSITVYSGGNDAFALEVMVALRKEGYEPELNTQEYPPDEDKVKKLLQQADDLLAQDEVYKRPKFAPSR